MGYPEKRHGEQHHNHKLTEAQVREIRALWAESERHRKLGHTDLVLRAEDIGKRYGVKAGAILNIVHRYTWKHI